MPDSTALQQVARELKHELNGDAFLTMPRHEVNEVLRNVTEDDTAMIDPEIGARLDMALLHQGIRCHPALAETETSGSVRLFHAGTLTGDIVDTVEDPNPQTDKQLAEYITKIKMRWVEDRDQVRDAD